MIWVEVMAGQLATSHPADGMDEVAMEQVLEPVLIWVVRVGTTVKLESRRILPTLFITCILKSRFSTRVNNKDRELTR